jgi:hypothetical protein
LWPQRDSSRALRPPFLERYCPELQRHHLPALLAVIAADREPAPEETRVLRHQLNHAAIGRDDLLDPVLRQLTPNALSLTILADVDPDEVPDPMHDPAWDHAGEPYDLAIDFGHEVGRLEFFIQVQRPDLRHLRSEASGSFLAAEVLKLSAKRSLHLGERAPHQIVYTP